MLRLSRLLAGAVCALAAVPLYAAGTMVVFDPSTPATGPFPTDFLTTFDVLQKTGMRINMPVPNCNTQYTACQEGALLDQLDGFSVRARAQVHFSGPVNTATLASGVFFVALANVTQEEIGVMQTGQQMPVNQVVYDPSTNTMYAKPDNVLDQHRHYALIVTDAVKDAAGNAVVSDPAYLACLGSGTAYCTTLAQAVATVAAGVAPAHIVAASVFTTLSATAWLEHARDILPFVPTAPGLVLPSSFSIPNLAQITLHEQTGWSPVQFTDLTLPLPSALLAGLGTLVVGYYTSPSFLEPDQSILNSPTLPGLEIPPNLNVVYYNALLPSTPEPPNGYPVVIFGHGLGDSRWGGPTAVAPVLARAGFAVIAINAVGHGFGPLSTVTLVNTDGTSSTIPAGGRGVDVNGDGIIGSDEGCTLITPVAYGTRDCFRQTAVDLLQLSRLIQQGLDLNGDGHPDLDATHVYYSGDSLGSMYGPMFMSVAPAVRAATFTVGGATTVDIARWSPAYASLATETMAVSLPPLLNEGNSYNEDYVLPDQPVDVVTVAGALPIQSTFENLEWLGIIGDPIAFLPHLNLSPLAGQIARPALVQFAFGDMTVPNPMNTALIRAAGLQASTWEYRHDLARALAPDLPVDPHPFLELFVSLGGNTIQLPGLDGLVISLDAQGQLAGFFQADGASIPNPNQLSLAFYGIDLFQVPTTLPETLNF
ncbi:MAG TPA: Ig-like domain-containing protein [Bryobacteraceae bacterium]|nr:Ig-like domain-containing protein [Bryobacteraceae bacterium]